MRFPYEYSAFALILLSVAACAPKQKGPPPPPPPVTLSSRPQATGGEALFIEKCIMCHGQSGMGTGLLARRVQPAMLEERDDLDRDYVISAVRLGIGNMPMMPRGEVSDAQLGLIADYLTAPKKGGKK